MPLAYLVGTYPAVSHTFISREVEGLRARGVDVRTFSVRRPGSEQLLSGADREAAAETPSIQPARATVVLGAQLRALSVSPPRYVRALVLALRLSPGGLRAGLWHFFYFLEATILWAWCRERGIRHVHVHFANAASMIALLTAALGGGDWSWSFTMHGYTEFDDVTHFRLAEKVGRARFVACISDFARAQLMKLVDPSLWPKLQIVRCGVDPRRFTPRPGRETSDRLRILCVGRLVPEKGQGLLIHALAELRDRGLPIELELVGEGPERHTLERLATGLDLGERVRFLGALDQEAVRRRYAAADIFCLPSFAEGVPVVLMEAMALEVPVVATRIMGIPELVEDGTAGLLVPPGRADVLVGALAALADDEGRRRAMGAAGRRRVVAEYNLDAQVEGLLTLLPPAPERVRPVWDRQR